LWVRAPVANSYVDNIRKAHMTNLENKAVKENEAKNQMNNRAKNTDKNTDTNKTENQED